MNYTVQGLYGPEDFFDPTHYYVRFLPQNSLDYGILLSDTTLTLFDYPLDYEISQYGDYYHDPSIPEDEITWQYTVVPVDYQFPQMQYEILEECFIPYGDFEPSDYGAEMNSSNSNISVNGVSGTNSTNGTAPINIDFAELERQAFINSGNANFLPKTSVSTRATKTRPWGEIHIYDTEDSMNLKALEGAVVTARIFVKIGQSTTDANGFFEINKEFTGLLNAHYVIHFQNHYAKVVRLLCETRKNIGYLSVDDKKNIAIFADSIQKAKHSSFSGISICDNRAWTAGTIINAVSDYFHYSDTLFIPRNNNRQLRILLTNALSSFAESDDGLGWERLCYLSGQLIIWKISNC